MVKRITYACGHEGAEYVFGTPEEQERVLTLYRARGCRQCERDLALHTARREASALGLPPLHGSERQVAWATKLRSRFYAKMRLVGYRMEQSSLLTWERKLIEALLSRVLRKQSAEWWISNREERALALITREGKKDELVAMAGKAELVRKIFE